DRRAVAGEPYVSAVRGVPETSERQRSRDLGEGESGPRTILGGLGGGARLADEVGSRAGVESAGREMVRRRKAQRVVQLPRSTSRDARRQSRADLGRRARRD